MEKEKGWKIGTKTLMRKENEGGKRKERRETEGAEERSNERERE